MFQIAHRQIVDATRVRTLAPLEAADAHADVSRLGSPLAMTLLHADQAELFAALAGLPEEQRLVLILRFLRNMSHAEVGRQIGKSAGAVRALQHRALIRMRELLAAEDGERRSA